MVKKPLLPVVLLACSVLLAACDSTPPAVSTLMQQVSQACRADDQKALKACYATEGVTSNQIEQQLGSWEVYFNPAEHWTYSDISYVSLAAAANNKAILPKTIASAQSTMIGGIKFAPNIKVLGFILVSFKRADGTQAGATEPVGIASDGTAKIALIEPQH